MSTESAPTVRRALHAIIATLILASGPVFGDTPWGKDYFPNVTLTTEEGKRVRFFDDLVKDKIVVINFIYTSCPDTCPLETAQLTKVAEILGDRLGKDLFFYSITLDPEVDTPAVLKKYKNQYNANWTFLTGSLDDIWALQKKLGLFLEEIKDGLNNHNVNMIIGNQATGRWMKRSPHENPYVLADQIGNWLDGWKRPPELDNYANAPKLRDLPRGEQLFRTRCASCHSLAGKDPVKALGPDLLGVTRRREANWLLTWLRAPDQMLKDKDPIAIALFEKYNKLPMPNLRLNKEEALDLLKYLEAETVRKLGETRAVVATGPLPRKFSARKKEPAAQSLSPADERSSELADVRVTSKPPRDLVATMNAWIQEAHPSRKLNLGYLTLINVGSADLTLTGIQSETFSSISMQEFVKADGVRVKRVRDKLAIPAGGTVTLRPGGLHLIMKGRREPLSAGDRVDLILNFESGAQQTLTARVARH